MHIKQSTINPLIDDLSKGLLESAIELKSKSKEEGLKLIKKIINITLKQKIEQTYCGVKRLKSAFLIALLDQKQSIKK